MSRLIDLTGRRYGRLVVIGRARNAGGKNRWKCVCDCGAETEVLAANLTRGATKSCGCLRKTHAVTHGKNGTPTYRSWHKMLSRCRNTAVHNYANYGGRGIGYDPRWEQFEEFLFDMGERPLGTTLDRINPDGDYCKNNCRWATPKEQQRNRRCIVMYQYAGRQQCLAAWAEEFGIGAAALRKRIRRGWDLERALNVPTARKKTDGQENT